MFVLNSAVFFVGYVYLVFENEKSVRALLHACSQDPFHPEDSREYYFKMSSRRMRCKDVSRNKYDVLNDISRTFGTTKSK